MPTTLTKAAANKVNAGYVTKYTFKSKSLGDSETHINVYIPPLNEGEKAPVLYYLSGLTCTEDNATQKGGFFKSAASLGLALVFMDTSPRGTKCPDDTANWDFGEGAGFYVNATNEDYSKYYNMFDYVYTELPQIVAENFPQIDTSKASIFGHSMGGHGAILLYLKGLEESPKKYQSVSAFAPISSLSTTDWGEKALGKFFAGGDLDAAKETYDASIALSKVDPKKYGSNSILVDQGTADNFYTGGRLQPEKLQEAAKKAGVDISVNLREGYDHSYFFISTFAPEHIKYHAHCLNQITSSFPK